MKKILATAVIAIATLAACSTPAQPTAGTKPDLLKYCTPPTPITSDLGKAELLANLYGTNSSEANAARIREAELTRAYVAAKVAHKDCYDALNRTHRVLEVNYK